MQNYSAHQTQAIKSGVIYMADNAKPQALIDSRDIAAVAAKVLSNPSAHAGKAYLLTGGEDFTGAQAAALISAAIDRPVQHVSVSTEVAVTSMNQWGMPPFIIDLMDSLNKIVSAGYASGVSGDVASILGQPPRTFKAYVAEHAAQWK